MLGGGAGALIVAAVIGQVLYKRAVRRQDRAQEPNDLAD
jgi:hypothetical protein